MTAEQEALDKLDFRLRVLLPEEYQESYEELQPIPMRSAPLKYDQEGRVAWDEIWGSFCDLAMAGGPPHKGMLLRPGAPADIAAAPDRYAEVTAEICRGIRLAAELDTQPSPVAGWVRVTCFNGVMADWLTRAIVMENVAARQDGVFLDLPAAPHFRLEKEIKNVVTVAAKTCHYWIGHIGWMQRRTIASLFAEIAQERPLIVPAIDDGTGSAAPSATATHMAAVVEATTGLATTVSRYADWLGVSCPDEHAAIWMMRALVVENVVARREATTLFVPVNPDADPDGRIVSAVLASTHTLAVARGVMASPQSRTRAGS